ncbi:MAG: nucleotidyl transferase AbiEii/AbiGii toxin family protein [Candidatus Babeliales bacterium]
MMLDAAVHKNILIHILKDIYTDTTIGPLLGFKGGTAAYLFYGLDRFSVDLDFDLLDSSQEHQVFEQLKKIVAEYGVIKESREKRYTLFFMLSYNDKLQKIKVEVNRRDFGSRYEVKSYLGIAMKVMVKEDMVAHKMVAMLERLGNANRDIFDTYFFLKHGWPINDQIITKRTGLSMHQFLKKCIEELEAMSNRDILSGLGELLDAKKKAWVKEKLRTETIFLIKLRLESYPTKL